MPKRKGTYPLPTTQELERARAAVCGHGIKVAKFSEHHYQIRTDMDASPRWMINLWPSTQRIAGEQKHPPSIRILRPLEHIARPWTLLSVVEAVIATIPNNKVPTDKPPRNDKPPQKDEPVFAPGVRITAEEWRLGFMKQVALLTRMAVATETAATKLDNIVGRLERIEEAYRDDGCPAEEIDDLNAEVASVTADTCDAKPDAEPAAEVTLADAKAVLQAGEFSRAWITKNEDDPCAVYDRAADILYGEMVASERRLEKQVAATVDEKARRVYYQNIVYECCRIIDIWCGGNSHIVCGTAENPSTDLEDAVRTMASVASRVTTEPLTSRCPECDADDDLPSNITVTITELPECSGDYVRTDEPPPTIPGLPPGLEARVKAKWPRAVLSYSLGVPRAIFCMQEYWRGPCLAARQTMAGLVEWIEANVPELPVEAEEKLTPWVESPGLCDRCQSCGIDGSLEPCLSCDARPSNFEAKT